MMITRKIKNNLRNLSLFDVVELFEHESDEDLIRIQETVVHTNLLLLKWKTSKFAITEYKYIFQIFTVTIGVIFL